MAKVEEIFMDEKYTALRWMVYALYTFAVLMVLGGAYFFIEASSFMKGIAVIYLISSIVLAIVFVLVAQMTKLYIDIEWNQRETNELLVQIIKNQKGEEL